MSILHFLGNHIQYMFVKTHLPTLATTLTTKPLTLNSNLNPTPVWTHARRQMDQQTSPESTRACSSVVSRSSSTEPQPTVCMYWQVHWHFRLDVFVIGKRRFERISSVFEVLLALSTHSVCLEDLKESSMPTGNTLGSMSVSDWNLEASWTISVQWNKMIIYIKKSIWMWCLQSF